MAGFLGADVEALRTLAGQLHSRADEVETFMNGLRTQLEQVNWTGPDADGFRNEWHNTHGPQLMAVVTALRGASTSASTNAQQQEDTSSH
jgi:uncharacterized protein YukE